MEWIQLSEDRIQRWAIEMNSVVPEWRQPASQVLCFMGLINPYRTELNPICN
jgi:hypothetical protein